MAVSQNGWSANDRSVVEAYTVGKGMRVSLRKGDAGFLLKHLADWFDANIKDIDLNYRNGELDDWGYAERPIRGATALSNHASGTAIDVNATNWPLGVEPSAYLNQDQINRLRDHLRIYEGAIRWGGDYTGRKDPMHFEINANGATVTRVANKLRAQAAASALRFPIIGRIREAFDRFGGVARLGQPLGPEVPTGDPKGRWQNFQFGRILWHPGIDNATAHVIFGDIEKRFIEAGYEHKMGWPITDELITPDRRGRFNHFSSGASIYWLPETGPKIIKGGIKDTWKAQGWERGPLGYPIGEEHETPEGIIQEFQGGRILWHNGEAITIPR